MKRNLVIALCLFIGLCGCGSKDPNKIFARQWRLDSFTSQALDTHLAMMKAMVDTVKDSAKKSKLKQAIGLQDQYIKDMKKMVMSCNADGSYKTTMIVIGQKQEAVGTWTLIDDAKRVVLAKDNDMRKADTLNVTELSHEAMTLSAPDGQGGYVYMHYKANKE